MSEGAGLLGIALAIIKRFSTAAQRRMAGYTPSQQRGGAMPPCPPCPSSAQCNLAVFVARFERPQEVPYPGRLRMRAPHQMNLDDKR